MVDNDNSQNNPQGQELDQNPLNDQAEQNNNGNLAQQDNIQQDPNPLNVGQFGDNPNNEQGAPQPNPLGAQMPDLGDNANMPDIQNLLEMLKNNSGGKQNSDPKFEDILKVDGQTLQEIAQMKPVAQLSKIREKIHDLLASKNNLDELTNLLSSKEETQSQKVDKSIEILDNILDPALRDKDPTLKNLKKCQKNNYEDSAEALKSLEEMLETSSSNVNNSIEFYTCLIGKLLKEHDELKNDPIVKQILKKKSQPHEKLLELSKYILTNENAEKLTSQINKLNCERFQQMMLKLQREVELENVEEVSSTSSVPNPKEDLKEIGLSFTQIFASDLHKFLRKFLTKGFKAALGDLTKNLLPGGKDDKRPKTDAQIITEGFSPLKIGVVFTIISIIGFFPQIGALIAPALSIYLIYYVSQRAPMLPLKGVFNDPTLMYQTSNNPYSADHSNLVNTEESKNSDMEKKNLLQTPQSVENALDDACTTLDDKSLNKDQQNTSNYDKAKIEKALQNIDQHSNNVKDFRNIAKHSENRAVENHNANENQLKHLQDNQVNKDSKIHR